ncbi:hypothetical protein NIES2100_21290 [Calothrix sp. NIES-2100]|uniref:hypothetical protein n=1 Tax=Calothrix sp. NIES-2100 TaxID=1954172 RepID=UPI000B61C690|nr:hypothetical protein NIES2100_21290 [Calothrix sp. NIES-2100]
MNNLSLAQCFGKNSLQNSNSLVIYKSDLPGLTPTAINTAEELVVGILLKILENFEGSITDENGNTITDVFGLPITYNQGDFVNAFNLFYWRINYTQSNGINYKNYQLVFSTFEIWDGET